MLAVVLIIAGGVEFNSVVSLSITSNSFTNLIDASTVKYISIFNKVLNVVQVTVE